MANRGRTKIVQNCHGKVKLSKTRPIKRLSKTFAYLIMKKNWIEKIAKLLSHSICHFERMKKQECMHLERLRIFAVRLFTGMDRNWPNNRNGLPELTSIFTRLYKDRVAFNSYS